VAGLGGMRQRDGSLGFAPRLPEGLDQLAFGIAWQGRQLHVEVTPAATTYRLDDGDTLEISHFGTATTVEAKRSAVCPTPKALAPRTRPVQPRGREPLRRQCKNDPETPGATR
jgi:alpha,alpha-trehalose phosphorylase